MRVLLAHNSLYYPSHGGGDKSNRLLMEALAERGHEVRVVTRVERFGRADHDKLITDLRLRGVAPNVDDGVIRFARGGVDVRVLSLDPAIRPFFSRQIEEFRPDVIVTSTDDPGQLLFDLAVKSEARVVYLVRATIAVPFGPESSAPNATKAQLLKRADGVVGVSQYVADYVRRWGGLDAIHVPISLLDGPVEYPELGRYENRFVAMVNPCAVKGIGIFLELADRMPDVEFAAVPTWGTTAEDRAALESRPNVTLLRPVDDIDDLLRMTKVMLVPSVWAEARSRIVVEAMSRGVPVISSDVGGLPEAHLGVPYMLPVNVIASYKPGVDLNMVPVAEVPQQDVGPWQQALRRVVSDREHWEELSKRSREAALEYARNLNVLPFEKYLLGLLDRPAKTAGAAGGLSDEKRRLLALRLKQKAGVKPQPDPWFAGIEEIGAGQRALFCFPYAGAGTLVYRSWRDVVPAVAVRLPGRESRAEEAPAASIEELVSALAGAIAPHIESRPYAFFGHSMGAGIAFELTRLLRDRGLRLPSALIVSAAKAPQYRLGWDPGPEPEDEQLLEQLRRLEGIPPDVLDNPELMRILFPVLRADTSLYRRYVYRPGEPLAIPICAYGGADDPNVRPEHLEEWREQTTARFVRREFAGGHFYFNSSKAEFLAALGNDFNS
jgi:surfactin synthase thioesterase subunit/glycosyltransferase involved in cell wall biosynthesis